MLFFFTNSIRMTFLQQLMDSLVDVRFLWVVGTPGTPQIVLFLALHHSWSCATSPCVSLSPYLPRAVPSWKPPPSDSAMPRPTFCWRISSDSCPWTRTATASIRTQCRPRSRRKVGRRRPVGMAPAHGSGISSGRVICPGRDCGKRPHRAVWRWTTAATRTRCKWVGMSVDILAGLHAL